MKQIIINLFALTILLSFSNITYGQSSYTKKLAGELWKSLREDYILYDKAEFNIPGNKEVITREISFKNGKEYLFVGIVDDCNDCKLSLKLVRAGQSSAKVPNVDSKITRSANTTQSTIIYKFIAGKTGRGVYELFNKSNNTKFVYFMILEKK